MLLDADGRPLRRVIGFLAEYRRVEISTPISDIFLVGFEVALDDEEALETCEQQEPKP